MADVVKELGGKPFLTDCNTLYVGSRKNTLEHIDCAYQNGFTPYATGCQIIIADGLKGTDETLVPVKNGEYMREAKIGHALMDADIVISLTHFKGHRAGRLRRLHEEPRHGRRQSRRQDGAARCRQARSVVSERCVGCRACERICAHGAVSFPGTRSARSRAAPWWRRRWRASTTTAAWGAVAAWASQTENAIAADYGQAADVLNYKIAEYTQAIVQDRPQFHISLAMDISPNSDCHAENDTPIVPSTSASSRRAQARGHRPGLHRHGARGAGDANTVLTKSRAKLEASGGVPEHCAHDHFNVLGHQLALHDRARRKDRASVPAHTS